MSYPSDETIRMLRNIRDYAFTIDTRAQWVSVDVEVIQNRPDWPTMAEDELEKALMHLNAAATTLHTALRRLRDKPVELRECRLCGGPLPCLTHREGDVPCLT